MLFKTHTFSYQQHQGYSNNENTTCWVFPALKLPSNFLTQLAVLWVTFRFSIVCIGVSTPPPLENTTPSFLPSPPLKLANCPSPPFLGSPPLFIGFLWPPPKSQIFQRTPKILKFFILNSQTCLSNHLFKATTCP